MKKPLIVGFDPGTTAALAILDTNGELLYLYSKKGLRKSEILENVTARGKALIVAADRNPLPRSVEKLASILGSKVYYPVKSLTATEKIELIKNFKLKIKSPHEKDALAAAYKAFKVYVGLFKKTKQALDATGLERYYPEVVEKIIFEEEENISAAIEEVMQEREKARKEKIEVEREVKPSENILKKVEQVKEELRRREKDILILRNYNEDLRKRLNDANKKLDYYRKRIRETSGVETVKVEGRLFEKALEEMRKLREIELNGFILVIEIDDIRSDTVEKIHQDFDLRKRIVFCRDSSNAQLLNDYDILVLITTKEPNSSVFEKVNFPIILEKNITLEKKDNYRVVEFNELERKLKVAKKEGLVEWLESYRKRRL